MLDHYEGQSEDEAAAEDEAARSGRDRTMMEIPTRLVSAVRELLARGSGGARGSGYAAALSAAIKGYDFPTVTCDFEKREEIRHPDMRNVETWVRRLLLAGNRCDVRDGLSNVLYWGYMNSPGLRDVRVGKFRKNVTANQLDSFMRIARRTPAPGLRDLKGIGLPEFSGMSFVTKIMMFLNPDRQPVLDMKLAEAFSQSPDFPPLQALTFRKKADFGKKADTQVRITQRNERVYNEWAAWCTRIAAWATAEPASSCRSIRAVDVERAVFTLAASPDRTDAWRLLRGPER